MKHAIAAFALILTVAAAHADIYKYRDSSGKLVISNTPPPESARQVERGGSIAPITRSNAPSPSVSTPRRRPAPKRSYVDLHPLAIGKPKTFRTEVWWKTRVVGTVENRSGRTAVENLRVTITCNTGHRDVAYISRVAPRGRDVYETTVIWWGNHRPRTHAGYTPHVQCSASAKWVNVFDQG